MTVVIPADLPKVLVDRQRMEQVFLNLLDNAAKFTPPGGRVVLEVSERDGQVQLTVSDSGPGIPEGSLDRIFERFYQTEASRTRAWNRGAGLGLAIASWIVTSHHDGRITASNRPEGGARMLIELPTHGTAVA